MEFWKKLTLLFFLKILFYQQKFIQLEFTHRDFFSKNLHYYYKSSVFFPEYRPFQAKHKEINL